MRTITLLTLTAAFALAQTPLNEKPATTLDVSRAELTNEEKLALENAQLKLTILESQKKDIQEGAQKVFEGACKRAGFDLAACRFDAQTASVKKVEPAKPEVKK